MNSLYPFNPPGPALISGSLKLEGRHLHLNFNFELHEINDGPLSAEYSGAEMQRTDELWRTTCFEAFWRAPGSQAYYELNLSANSPRWNLYRFEDYRKPQPPTVSHDFEIQNLRVWDKGLQCTLNSASIWPKLEANICAVLKDRHAIHYYALNHPAEKADFHHPGGFVLRA